MAMAALIFFAACSKDGEGVYNPKKKIANLYQSSMYVYSWHDEVNDQWIADTSSEAKTLVESWTWDGKKLAKITFYEHRNVTEKDDVEVYDVVNFTYDGKRVTRAEGNDEYITFAYDGKEVKSAVLFDKEHPESPEAQFDFEHKDGKIVKINVTIEGDGFDFAKSSTVHLEKVLFRNILPEFDKAEEAVAKINTAVQKSGAKAQTTIPIELTWSGDNVSEMTVKMTLLGMVATSNNKYTYDNKNNPYQNYLFGMVNVMDDGTMTIFCKNNVTKIFAEESFFGMTETEEVNYTYTYDGDWPVSQTQIRTYEDEDGESKEYSTVTNYFEYK